MVGVRRKGEEEMFDLFKVCINNVQYPQALRLLTKLNSCGERTLSPHFQSTSHKRLLSLCFVLGVRRQNVDTPTFPHYVIVPTQLVATVYDYVISLLIVGY